MIAAPIDLQRRRFGPGGGVYDIVATAEETRNTHFALIATEPPGGGPPLHTHAENEFFLVLDGEVSFWIDSRITVASIGQATFVPGHARHCFKNRSNRTARVLVMFTPGDIEKFFDYGLPIDGMAPSDDVLIERIGRLGPKFGLELLGPSPL
jgi:mannose-6-phosphate isomerase-like protein (cupin superfamily)